MRNQEQKPIPGVENFIEKKGYKTHKGLNSVATRLEQKTGLLRTDPNFLSAVEDVLANETEDFRQTSLDLLQPKQKTQKVIVVTGNHASHTMRED